MKKFRESKITLLAPRSFPILLLQITIGLSPICTVIIILLTIFLSGSHFTLKDAVYMSAICVSFLLVSFVAFYFPQKYIPRLAVDENKDILKKYKKGHGTETYNINTIKNFVSKRILPTFPGGQYKLIIEKFDGSSVVLFSEYTPCKGSRWERYSERVAHAVDKPLVKEKWLEDYNGKLFLISPEKLISSKM